jgi:23S rRNA (cytosine1962-C5)-methyltransferase
MHKNIPMNESLENNNNNSLYNRLVKNFKKLAPWARRQNLEAYRLYDKDIPEYPFMIDIYKNYCVIYEQGLAMEPDSELRQKHLEDIEKSLTKILNVSPDYLIWKIRYVDKGGGKYQKNFEHPISFLVQEGELNFEVNLTQYLDTGLFLDHRPLRKKLQDLEAPAKVLNLFSYTGSLSVAAAKAGATVTSVDLSNTYLQWSKRNFAHNNIDINKHEFIASDTLTYLKYLRAEKATFDVILFDPPTFSNSKKTPNVFDVERDHFDYLNLLRYLLVPQGDLVFSTNKRKFRLDEKVAEKFSITDWTPESLPMDFRNKIHQCFWLRAL